MSLFSMGILADLRSLRDKCAAEHCHNSRLRHSRFGEKTGVRLGEEWFCSDDCFRQAVEIRISQLQKKALKNPPQRKSRLPLGLLLLSRGCITNQQLTSALERQRQSGGPLGDILCRMKFTTDRDVAAAAATQWGCPVFHPRSCPCQVQAHIPSSLMNLYSMVPVHYSLPDNKLYVGFVYGVEHHVLHIIENITSCLTEPCIITASQCRETINSLPLQNNEVTFTKVTSAAEMANIIQSYASQIGAEDARLGVCRDYVWTRLNRKDHPTDLLFSLCGEAPTEHEFVQH